jgi:hypothetical protein
LLGTLRRLGPGMIIAGSIVGSGELILTTKVGAEAGFWLLWLVVIGCVIKVSTQIEFARHAITWGDTPLKALNAVPGPRLRVNWLLWYWTFMTILVVFQQGGILGGVGQTLAISRPLTAYGDEYNRLQDSLVKVRIDLKVLQVQDPNDPSIMDLERNVTRLAEHISQRREPADPYLWALILAAVTSLLLYVGRYGLIHCLDRPGGLVHSRDHLTVIAPDEGNGPSRLRDRAGIELSSAANGLGLRHARDAHRLRGLRHHRDRGRRVDHVPLLVPGKGLCKIHWAAVRQRRLDRPCPRLDTCLAD